MTFGITNKSDRRRTICAKRLIYLKYTATDNGTRSSFYHKIFNAWIIPLLIVLTQIVFYATSIISFNKVC
jgi:hypothetical protein